METSIFEQAQKEIIEANQNFNLSAQERKGLYISAAKKMHKIAENTEDVNCRLMLIFMAASTIRQMELLPETGSICSTPKVLKRPANQKFDLTSNKFMSMGRLVDKKCRESGVTIGDVMGDIFRMEKALKNIGSRKVFPRKKTTTRMDESFLVVGGRGGDVKPGASKPLDESLPRSSISGMGKPRFHAVKMNPLLNVNAANGKANAEVVPPTHGSKRSASIEFAELVDDNDFVVDDDSSNVTDACMQSISLMDMSMANMSMSGMLTSNIVYPMVSSEAPVVRLGESRKVAAGGSSIPTDLTASERNMLDGMQRQHVEITNLTQRAEDLLHQNLIRQQEMENFKMHYEEKIKHWKGLFSRLQINTNHTDATGRNPSEIKAEMKLQKDLEQRLEQQLRVIKRLQTTVMELQNESLKKDQRIAEVEGYCKKIVSRFKQQQKTPPSVV